jgi:ubiquinone/menaquinone biosynthesis C-methylase UbiE
LLQQRHTGEWIVTTAIDQANAEFWNELCGSGLARSLGITEHSPESLERFDQAYLSYYPYLLRRVGLNQIAGRAVLEVGLGYGTLSQQLARVARDYTGLDVAAGPVNMVNQRLDMQRLPGRAVQGSMLDAPFPSESFDAVISIGCFHVTGDIQRCIDETYRVLRPGGIARIMVYNRFSYRQWLKWPKQTLAAAIGGRWNGVRSTVEQRAAYDTNSSGDAAPEMVFVSTRQLKVMFRHYSHFACYKENSDDLVVGGYMKIPRRFVLPTCGRLAGLDLYVDAWK